MTRIRVDDRKYHPYVLLEYLRSLDGMRMLESIQSGTTIRVLNNANLQRMRIPGYNLEMMHQVGEQLREKSRKHQAEMRQITKEYERQKSDLLDLLGFHQPHQSER